MSYQSRDVALVGMFAECSCHQVAELTADSVGLCATCKLITPPPRCSCLLLDRLYQPKPEYAETPPDISCTPYLEPHQLQTLSLVYCVLDPGITDHSSISQNPFRPDPIVIFVVKIHNCSLRFMNPHNP